MRNTMQPRCTGRQRVLRWMAARPHAVAANKMDGHAPVPFSPRIARLFTKSAGLAATLLIAAALTVMAGWIWNMQLLTTFLPGQHSMKANVAIAFALSGAALLLCLQAGRNWRAASKLLSLLVVGIGAATFSQYVGAFDLGIDTLLPLVGPPPSRMPELVAVALVLLGSQGLLVSTGRYMLVREGLAIALLAIAMVGISSYGLPPAEPTGSRFERVPIHTVVLLLVAALGWMSAAPGAGLTRVAMADTFGGKVARRLLLPALLLPVIFATGMESLRSWFGVPRPLSFALAALFTGGTVACLVWWVATLLDSVERQRRESASLRFDAMTDALTTLPNRRAFDEMLARLLNGLREDDATFSMLLLDLDGFKAYNDSFGHQEGDEALRSAAGVLRAALHPADFAARFGGEEFVVLLLGADATRANAVATRILTGFRTFRWPLRTITVSIGIAEVRVDESARELIRRVDDALYRAKRAGRNQAVMATIECKHATVSASCEGKESSMPNRGAANLNLGA